MSGHFKVVFDGNSFVDEDTSFASLIFFKSKF